MSPEDFQKLKQILAVPLRVVLVGHKSPDGDAVGACLAMQHYLERKGHQVQSIVPDGMPDFLSWLPDFSTIARYDTQEEICNQKILESDFIFMLDFNALHRLGAVLEKEITTKTNEQRILIDHHIAPEPIAAYMYSDPQACSTCQMVYDFILKMGEGDLIDKQVATCIYTGIMTDTLSFKTPLTSSHTHRVAADLIARGAVNYQISQYVYQQKTQQNLQILAIALRNLKVLSDVCAAYITLPAADLAHIERKKGDTEDLVNYALSLKNIHFAAIFIEDPQNNRIKISFRSQGNFSVNTFARKHFQGGGHQNAAGGISHLPLSDTIVKFEKLVLLLQKKINFFL